MKEGYFQPWIQKGVSCILFFSHPSTMFVSSSTGFQNFNLIVDAKKISLSDKINHHTQTSQFIFNHFNKSFSVTTKAKGALEKVVNQLKLEKANSRALNTEMNN